MVVQELGALTCQAGEAVVLDEGLDGAAFGCETEGVASLVAVGYPGALGYLKGLFLVSFQDFDMLVVGLVEDVVSGLIFGF